MDGNTLFDTSADEAVTVTATPTSAAAANTTAAMLEAVQAADQDFEWYPTTAAMIGAVAAKLPYDFRSIMDIGAGDGRVLLALADHKRRQSARYEAQRNTRTFDREANAYRQATASEILEAEREQYKLAGWPEMFSIEKSTVLAQAQPDTIIPVGADFYQQNLTCIPVDYIFCNPPYSDFETWAAAVIETGYAKAAYLVIPRRWKESAKIAQSLKSRGAKASVIHSDDFQDAERRARALVDVVEIRYPVKGDRYYKSDEAQDPFDIWFDANVGTFEKEEELKSGEVEARELARLHKLHTIGDMVAAFDEEYARMEDNYRAIFKLDYEILRELNVNKEGVREGIKKRMAGLKIKYWQLLFNRLDTITNRLATATKELFLKKLTGRQSIAFTSSNAYLVAMWAIKNANKYFDEQLVALFRELSTFDGVMNYKSNQKTWKNDGWRYLNSPNTAEADKPSHYALDYRIVLGGSCAIGGTEDFRSWDYPGGLHKGRHELIADVVAVLYNLGFSLGTNLRTFERSWEPNQWQDFYDSGENVLFQVKAFKNGNMHFRFKPEAIRALNVEAGRLMGWLRSKADVVEQLGYSVDEAARYFGSHRLITAGGVKLLEG